MACQKMYSIELNHCIYYVIQLDSRALVKEFNNKVVNMIMCLYLSN